MTPDRKRPAETAIPSYAKTATGKAHKQAVSSGKRVLVSGKDGKVSQVNKDGSTKVVDRTSTWTSVKVGSKRRLS